MTCPAPLHNTDVAPLPAWHALAAGEVITALDTTESAGLTQAESALRLGHHGENRLIEVAPKPTWRRFALQFHNPLIYVLLAAGATTLALGSHVDAAVIFGVVLINAVIGHIQEGKAERALDAVRDMLAAHANVWRAGERHRVDATSLVPGDIVLLESGDKVPADVRLIHARNLRVVEAALTGESVPVEKSVSPVSPEACLADRLNMCHSGTLVSSGQGRGVVVATGAQTEIGRIGGMVGEVATLATPLTRRLDQFARQITAFILAVAVLTMLYGHFVAHMPLLELFLAVVGLAVAAIPEGMPAVVTIVLAIGTRVMARQKAIVRRLPAVETLGSVTVICSDKTGTLTRNEMSAVRVMLPDTELTVTGSGHAPEGGFLRASVPVDPITLPALMRLAQTALLCNDARLSTGVDGIWTLVGDPTEGALLTLAHKAGLQAAQAATDCPRVDAIAFESERQYMATLHHDHTAGDHVVLLKGSPERVLALCTMQAGGQPVQVADWHARIERAAGSGERVLALARCDWPEGRTTLDVADMTPRFELLGMVGLIDPPRPEAMAAVAQCQQAGIRVKMITGDHASTAAAIGRQLGLAADRTLTGDVIERLDDAELRTQVQTIDVFARASPEHKLRLISALQSHGHLVAMTGDGVNDAPALKAADIGVAMGCKGTDAAREAADLVLVDDNFATIARAVREGRVVYDNIRKALMHMLPTNGGEAGVILLALLAGMPLPVTAGQILWVNTVTSVTLALALAFEPAEPGVMSHPPRATSERILNRALSRRILFVIGLMVMATFAVFHWELERGSSLEVARTAAVNTIVVCEMFYLLNVRRHVEHAWRLETLTGNRMAMTVLVVLAGLQLLFTYAAPMQAVFQSASLDAMSWSVIGLMGALLFVAVECEKWVLRRSGVQRL
jgi:magnesium-transporting ATPase (P-type)